MSVCQVLDGASHAIMNWLFVTARKFFLCTCGAPPLHLHCRMVMRASIVFLLCGASVGLEARKPADMSDLTAVADFASSAADLFLDAAKSLPSPAEAQAALAAQDEKEIHAMLAADAAAPGSSAHSASSFLSGPSSGASIANIRFVEPAGAALRDVVAVQGSLDAALAALEERQRSSEAHVAAVLGSVGNVVRR